MTLESPQIKTEEKIIPRFSERDIDKAHYLEVISLKDKESDPKFSVEKFKKSIGTKILINPGTGFACSGVLIGLSERGYPVLENWEMKDENYTVKERDIN